MQSILPQIIDHAAAHPDTIALTLIDDSGEEVSYSYAELVRKSWQRAIFLQKKGVVREDLVLLLIHELEELIPLFFGAMMIGSLPAILPVPVTGIVRASHEHLRERIIQTRARMLITSPEMCENLTSTRAPGNAEIVATSEFADDPADSPNNPIIDLSDTAYVQFSSGTTSIPKGLMVSHAALFNQVRHYARAIALTESDRMISWSPLYHDQGLLSNMLMPLSKGVHTVLMTPATWLKNPVLFFEAVDRHQCTVSRWPNFAFLYTAGRITDRQMKGISLQNLRLIASSGEPITEDAWPVFKQRFGPYGLRNGVMNGSYGMAENCLCIAISPLDEPLREEALSLQSLNNEGVARAVAKGDEGSQVFVSSGKAMEGTEIRIINERGEYCSDRVVGEIAIKGDCLLDHYYPNRPFPESCYSNGFYLTGDIGYLADGWLTVTGRKKDIVIIGGNSIHPEQVERIASNIQAIRPGRVIALGVSDPKIGTEKLVVICELIHDDEQTRQKVRRQLQNKVLENISIWLSRIEFKQRGWIEKTTSGKLSRFRNREKLLAGEG